LSFHQIVISSASSFHKLVVSSTFHQLTTSSMRKNDSLSWPRYKE
jgi:hypothetical protein